jgi:hypothetical protein
MPFTISQAAVARGNGLPRSYAGLISGQRQSADPICDVGWRLCPVLTLHCESACPDLSLWQAQRNSRVRA